jgi:hypothetical protein
VRRGSFCRQSATPIRLSSSLPPGFTGWMDHPLTLRRSRDVPHSKHLTLLQIIVSHARLRRKAYVPGRRKWCRRLVVVQSTSIQHDHVGIFSQGTQSALLLLHVLVQQPPNSLSQSIGECATKTVRSSFSIIGPGSPREFQC